MRGVKRKKTSVFLKAGSNLSFAGLGRFLGGSGTWRGGSANLGTDGGGGGGMKGVERVPGRGNRKCKDKLATSLGSRRGVGVAAVKGGGRGTTGARGSPPPGSLLRFLRFPSLLPPQPESHGSRSGLLPNPDCSPERTGSAQIPASASPRRPALRWAPCGHSVNICGAH